MLFGSILKARFQKWFKTTATFVSNKAIIPMIVIYIKELVLLEFFDVQKEII